MMNRLTIIFFAVILVISACNKKPNAEVDNETQSVLDFSNNSRDFLAITSAVHQALVYTPGTGANQSKVGLNSCNMLTLISGDTLWGTLGHINPTYSMNIENMLACNNESLIPQNKYLEGQVYVTLNEKLQNAGTLAIIKINGRWIQSLIRGVAPSNPPYSLCDSIILKTISSDANSASFDVSLVNGKLIQDLTGKTSKLTFNLKLQSFISNVTEPYVSFYGSAKGVNINNLPYTATISQEEPIIKAKSCYYYKSGKTNIEPDGFKKRTANYGAGNCDNDANFEVNGNTIAFKLK